MLKSQYLLLYILFLSCLGFESCSIHKLSKKGVYKEVSSKEYLLYVNDSTVNIIDVRTAAEYQKSHIKGALNVSYFGGHFKKSLVELDLDTNRTTLIYCETQHRSLFVAKKLYKAGFKSIIDLDKGMVKWRKKGLPFVN